MYEVIKSDLIVYFDQHFLILIKDVTGFISLDEVLKMYADKYAFDVSRLSGTWVSHSYLDYQKEIVNV